MQTEDWRTHWKPLADPSQQAAPPAAGQSELATDGRSPRDVEIGTAAVQRETGRQREDAPFWLKLVRFAPLRVIPAGLLILTIIVAMYLGGMFTTQEKAGTNAGPKRPPSALPITVYHAEVVASAGDELLRIPIRLSRRVFSDGVPRRLTLLIELDPKLNRDWFISTVTGYLVGDGPGDQMLMDNLSCNLPVDGLSKQYQAEVDLWELQPDATYLLHVDVRARQPVADSRAAVALLEQGDAVLVTAEWSETKEQ